MKRSGLDHFLSGCDRSAHSPAVVLGTTVNALSYVRSLGRMGVPVLCAEVEPRQAGRSRFGVFHLLEEDNSDETPGERASDHLFGEFKRRGVRPVVLGSSDAWQVYIARREAAEAAPFVSLTPSKEVIDLIVDKQAQYEFAVRQGIAVPTFANAGAVQRNEAEWSDFPAIIKPRWSHIGRDAIGGKAVHVESECELRAKLKELAAEGIVGEYIVQREVAGDDDRLFAYLACYDVEGNEFSYVIKRKLRQHPAQFGDGSYDVTCREDEVAEAGRRLLARMGYRGLVGIEFKRGDNGALELIEINPRAVSTNQLPISAGVDFPWHCYQLALHADRPESAPRPELPDGYRVGVHHMHEERDFRAFRERLARGEMGLVEWLGCIVNARSFAMWDVGDPKPFVSWAVDAVRERIGRPARPAAKRPTEEEPQGLSRPVALAEKVYD